MSKVITVNDKMQKGYQYTLECAPGKNMDFKPHFTPSEMLELGVFEGKYCRDCRDEFPASWYEHAKESRNGDVLLPANVQINKFKMKSRLNLSEWVRRGWIPICEGDMDVRGWFQWYMRYYLGRRMPHVDLVQIKRWRAITRHSAQVAKNCKHKSDKGCTDPMNCRPKQRQTLLQWSWNCFI